VPQPVEQPVPQPVEQPVEQPVSEATPATPLESGDTEPQNAVFTFNQEVLDNAANVGCEADPSVFSETILQLTNASRVEARMCGVTLHNAVPTLRWNNQLAQAALAR